MPTMAGLQQPGDRDCFLLKQQPGVLRGSMLLLGFAYGQIPDIPSLPILTPLHQRLELPMLSGRASEMLEETLHISSRKLEPGAAGPSLSLAPALRGIPGRYQAAGLLLAASSLSFSGLPVNGCQS